MLCCGGSSCRGLGSVGLAEQLGDETRAGVLLLLEEAQVGLRALGLGMHLGKGRGAHRELEPLAQEPDQLES